MGKWWWDFKLTKTYLGHRPLKLQKVENSLFALCLQKKQSGRVFTWFLSSSTWFSCFQNASRWSSSSWRSAQVPHSSANSDLFCCRSDEKQVFYFLVFYCGLLQRTKSTVTAPPVCPTTSCSASSTAAWSWSSATRKFHWPTTTTAPSCTTS